MTEEKFNDFKYLCVKFLLSTSDFCKEKYKAGYVSCIYDLQRLTSEEVFKDFVNKSD